MWQVFSRHLGRSKGRDFKAAALIDLSTVADIEISNPPWVKFQSAGWVNFPSAPTHEQLQALGNLDLIVCGFMTHSSVSTTVRATKDYGYRCTLVERACATRDLPGAQGLIDHTDMHRLEIAALADNFAVIVEDADSVH